MKRGSRDHQTRRLVLCDPARVRVAEFGTTHRLAASIAEARNQAHKSAFTQPEILIR
jgi:hypothetical protein